MKKNTVVHGVNITNCHYYVPCEETGLDCILLNNSSAKCSDDKYKYCYYKQLRRLEQENSDIKFNLRKYTGFVKDIEQKLKDILSLATFTDKEIKEMIEKLLWKINEFRIGYERK